MITKCDFPNCNKAGVCRAPKSRDLKEYWHFCREHAAEYNKNWDFYAGMTPEEMEDDWEKQTFGYSSKDKKQTSDEYVKCINDFLIDRNNFDKMTTRKITPSNVVSALNLFNLSINTNWREIGTEYRKLAKQHHPDIAKNKKTAAAEFAKINEAYKILESYFKKKA